MENRQNSLSTRKNFLSSSSIKPRKQNSESDNRDTGSFATLNNGGSAIPLSHDHCQHRIILSENKRLTEALENAHREIRKHADQLKMAQELIDTQRKYIQKVETNIKKLRKVEKENKKLNLELEEEKKLRTEANDFSIKLERLLLQFEEVPKKPSKVQALKALGLEAKLAARSTEDDAIFSTNIEAMYTQMDNFLGIVKTSLDLIKNHQKERRDEIENIVRKLVSCCYGNSVDEYNVKERSNSNQIDVIVLSGDENEGMDTSSDLREERVTLDTAEDNNGNSGEDTNNSETCGDASNDSGVSCFDPIELTEEPESIDDSSTFTPRKSIRERRRSVSLRDYEVPRKTLEIHEDHKNFNHEKRNDRLAKHHDGKRKGKKTLVQMPVLIPNLTRTFPCKTCGRRFKTAGKLKRHVKIHRVSQIMENSDSKRKICYLCGQSFPNKEQLDCHQMEYHKGDMPEKQRA